MNNCNNKLCNSYDADKEHNCNGNFKSCDPINHRQFLRDNKEPVATVLCSEVLCGCGKRGRYFIKGEMACNKWHRCPTYDELAGQVIELKVALFKIKGIIDETPA